MRVKALFVRGYFRYKYCLRPGWLTHKFVTQGLAILPIRQSRAGLASSCVPSPHFKQRAIRINEMRRPLKFIFVVLLASLFVPSAIRADRLKDLTSIAGVRSNQLVGYGLVVGLAGTGDGNATLTQQAMQSMISQFGVVTSAANINGKNAASVIVTAELPPFIKPGQSWTSLYQRPVRQNHCAEERC